MIEHDLALLGAVAERLVVLDFGRVVATGDPDTVLRGPRGRALVTSAPTPVPTRS